MRNALHLEAACEILRFSGKRRKEERKLILKKLTIEQFGKIRYFETSFDSKVSVISHSNSDLIVRAIGISTNNRTLAGHITNRMMSVNSHISAEIEVQGKAFLVNARGQPSQCGWAYDVRDTACMESMSPSKLFRSIRLCEEEEALTYYRYNGKDSYSDRFLHYKDPERYYASGEFQKKTDGVGLTRSFRACLAEYMKVHRVDETDRRRADFLCYLHVIKFWDCFQDIRDMHHEKWPIIIEAGEQYGNAEFAELLVAQSALGRQLLLKAANNF